MITPFVSWQWCEDHDVQLADVRWSLAGAGQASFEAGHIPGAVFISMDSDLSGPGSPCDGRHPFPSSAHFADRLGRAGIDGSRPVVAYDADGGLSGARLVWMLRTLNHDAALLDGGLAAYKGTLATGANKLPATTFPVGQWPSTAFATVADICDAVAPTTVVDARPPARFHGEDDLDARAGHMPGAVNVPACSHLAATGYLADLDTLRSRFAAAGVNDGTQVISSCGSGVTACFNLLVMEHIGLGKGRLFPPSWSGWAANRQLPIEQG